MSVVILIYFHFFFLQIYLKNRDLYTVEANNPRQLVEIAARDIEKLLSNRSKALVVSTNGLGFLFSVKKNKIIYYWNMLLLLILLPIHLQAVSAWCVQDMMCIKMACDFVVEKELISSLA